MEKNIKKEFLYVYNLESLFCRAKTGATLYQLYFN